MKKYEKISMAVLLSGIIFSSACGKEEKTALFIRENQEYLKRYEINENDEVNRISRSAIYDGDMGDLNVLNEDVDLVILGEVTEEPYMMPRLEGPYTFYSVQVKEILKGEGMVNQGDIIAACERQGVMTKKDYKYLALDEGGKFAEVMLREGFDAPDEELDQVYMDLTNGPQLHTGDELIFAMEKDANILTDVEGEFWYIYGDEYGKFYKIAENQYMRVFSSGGESGLTREMSDIEPKIMDDVFTQEDLDNIF